MRVPLISLCLTCLFAPQCVADSPRPACDAAGSVSDGFETRFTGKTLRFDYFHSGTATEEHISVDELRAEGDWPGSRTRLVDELGLGNFHVEVVDPKDDRVIYSRGFDSIFGEWQTTSEATNAWRTFHESQRFPEPRGEVRLVLKRRGNDGALLATRRVTGIIAVVLFDQFVFGRPALKRTDHARHLSTL